MSDKQARNARKRLEKLVETTGMTDEQMLIAVERYQQHERDIRRAREQADKVSVTVLPGTDFHTDEQARLKLVQRAVELDIHTGHYEDWELVQFADAVAQNKAMQIVDDLYSDSGLLAMMSLHRNIELTLTELATFVLATVGTLYARDEEGERIYPRQISLQQIDNLAGWYAVLLTLADDHEVPIEELPNPNPFMIGIKNLLNEHDNGESLRRAAAGYSPIYRRFEEWLKSRKTAGAPKQTVIDRLCARAKPYIEAGLTRAEAFDRITTDLDAIEHRTPNDEEDFQKLASWDVGAFEKAYHRRYGSDERVFMERT